MSPDSLPKLFCHCASKIPSPGHENYLECFPVLNHRFFVDSGAIRLIATKVSKGRNPYFLATHGEPSPRVHLQHYDTTLGSLAVPVKAVVPHGFKRTKSEWEKAPSPIFSRFIYDLHKDPYDHLLCNSYRLSYLKPILLPRLPLSSPSLSAIFLGQAIKTRRFRRTYDGPTQRPQLSRSTILHVFVRVSAI